MEEQSMETGRRTWLGGALVVERLGATADAGRFHTADARGAVAFLARGGAYEHLHVVEFREAGVRRGFHLHRGHREELYIFVGRVELVARAPAGEETVRVELEAGDLAVFAPGTAHGLVALSPAVAVAMGTGTDPIGDTVAVPDLGDTG